MHAELSFGLPAILGFLLVLARVSGVIIFVPIPGLTAAPEAARVALALTITVALLPVWPSPAAGAGFIGSLPISIASEFTFGLLVGITVAFLLEGVQIAAQMISLQAGFSFASTIDPATQADSGVLLVFTQIFAGVLFFALGLDRQVIEVLAYSLQKVPSVVSAANSSVALVVTRLSSAIFITGLRLALPVLALLILIDLTISIMGKVHAQMHMHALSFTAKMLAGLGLLAITLHVFPQILGATAQNTFEILRNLLGS